jgi:hypothetical protein
MHNVTLQKFSEPLLSISEPQNVVRINSLTKVGQQYANGDHCDYLAAVLLKTDLYKADIENYYKDNYTGKSEIKYVWLDEENSYTNNIFDPLSISSLKDWIQDQSENASGEVVVYIFEGGMTSFFDYRCS